MKAKKLDSDEVGLRSASSVMSSHCQGGLQSGDIPVGCTRSLPVFLCQKPAKDKGLSLHHSNSQALELSSVPAEAH